MLEQISQIQKPGSCFKMVTMNNHDEILNQVLDNAEMDVPACEIPKDMSLREEKNMARSNSSTSDWQKRQGKIKESNEELNRLYSPDQFLDSLSSPAHLTEDPLFPREALTINELVAHANDSEGKGSRLKKPTDVLLSQMLPFFAQCVAIFNEKTDEVSGKNSFEFIEDEMGEKQLQRLTSWNTIEEPYYGDTSNSIPPLTIDASNSPGSRTYPNEHASQRKRLVKFDYPVIKSIKECPRPDPDDLPNLYFTEEELGQYEDDRASTFIADDVEVVCVSTSHSSDSEDRHKNQDSHANFVQGVDGQCSSSSGKNSSCSKDIRESLDAEMTSVKNLPEQANSTSPQHRKPRSEETSRKRQIKSVQIYLRERSKEKS